jgi:hypothetical protein
VPRYEGGVAERDESYQSRNGSAVAYRTVCRGLAPHESQYE